MDERIIQNNVDISSSPSDDPSSQLIDPLSDLNISMIKRMVKKNLESTQAKEIKHDQEMDSEDLNDEDSEKKDTEVGENNSGLFFYFIEHF